MHVLHDKATPNLLPRVFKERNEAHHYLLKTFFEAGGIPDLATNPKDFETLTGLFERKLK